MSCGESKCPGGMFWEPRRMEMLSCSLCVSRLVGALALCWRSGARACCPFFWFLFVHLRASVEHSSWLMRPHSSHLIQTSHIHCTIFNILEWTIIVNIASQYNSGQTLIANILSRYISGYAGDRHDTSRIWFVRDHHGTSRTGLRQKAPWCNRIIIDNSSPIKLSFVFGPLSFLAFWRVASHTIFHLFADMISSNFPAARGLLSPSAICWTSSPNLYRSINVPIVVWLQWLLWLCVSQPDSEWRFHGSRNRA